MDGHRVIEYTVLAASRGKKIIVTTLSRYRRRFVSSNISAFGQKTFLKRNFITCFILHSSDTWVRRCYVFGLSVPLSVRASLLERRSTPIGLFFNLYKSLFTEKRQQHKNTAVQAQIQTKRKQRPSRSIAVVDTLHWSINTISYIIIFVHQT